jgi:hypothetical protein
MGLVDRLGNIHGHKTGKFEAKPPKPVGPLVFFPDIDRSDDEEVSEWVARMALKTGEGYHDLDRNPDAPLLIRYKPEDIKDRRGLKREVDVAQDFWAKATALGLTDWCSKEDFVRYFWLDRDRSDWYTSGKVVCGFTLCPDEEMGQQLTEMAKQYPGCILYEDMEGGALYFSSESHSREDFKILRNGGTLE